MFPELVVCSSPFFRADLYALYYIPLYYIPHGASPSSCGNHVVVCHRQGPSSTLPSIGPFWTGFSSLLLCHCRWMLVLVVLLVFITSAGAAGVEQEVRPPLLLTVAADYPYVYVPLSHPRLIIVTCPPSLPLTPSPVVAHAYRTSQKALEAFRGDPSSQLINGAAPQATISSLCLFLSSGWLGVGGKCWFGEEHFYTYCRDASAGRGG